MKYRQLTKEQFGSLHHEFSQFLATQKIDVHEWNQLKETNSKLVEEELNIFSDLVWEDVLTKVKYLEHFSKNTLNLFKCEEQSIERIVIKAQKESIDFLSEEGYKWLLQNPKDDCLEYLRGSKSFTERNTEIFDLIEKGGQISKGELYEYFNRLTS